jgi:hypothetical protein
MDMPSGSGPAGGGSSMRRLLAMIVAGLVLFGLFLTVVLVVLSFAARQGFDDDSVPDADFVQPVEMEGEDGTIRELLLLADVGDRCIGVAGEGFESTVCGQGGVAEGELQVFGRPLVASLAVAGSDASVAEIGQCDQEWTEVLNGFIATWCLDPS